jgi:hypothetical protein
MRVGERINNYVGTPCSMSLHAVFYEFEVNKANIEVIVEDIGITQKCAPEVRNVAENLLDLINRNERTYAKVEIYNKP